jgi:hypothetical protein
MVAVQDPDVFEAAFRPNVRVQFNWKRFHREAWPITVRSVTSRRELSELILPWYVSWSGTETAFDRLGARPIRVREVSLLRESLNERRRKGIDHYFKAFLNETAPITLAVPVYALPDGEFLVIGKCRRVVALALVKTSFAVTLYCVNGPIDRDCLLDLRHWQGETSSGAHEAVT